jgi:hypothetical protein
VLLQHAALLGDRRRPMGSAGEQVAGLAEDPGVADAAAGDATAHDTPV